MCIFHKYKLIDKGIDGANVNGAQVPLWKLLHLECERCGKTKVLKVDIDKTTKWEK